MEPLGGLEELSGRTAQRPDAGPPAAAAQREGPDWGGADGVPRAAGAARRCSCCSSSRSRRSSYPPRARATRCGSRSAPTRPRSGAARPAPARARPLAARSSSAVPRRAPARRPRHVDQPAAARERRSSGRGSRRASSCSSTARSSRCSSRCRSGSSRRSTATAPPTTAIRVVATVGLAMPSFWFGLLLVEVFSLHARARCRSSGYGAGFFGHLESLTLPAITVGIYLAPLIIRTLRSSLIETLVGRLHHLGARARLPRDARVGKHALRNALIATITILAINIGYLISGTVVIENVFAIPGLGSLLVLVDPDARLPDDLGADAPLRRARDPRQPARRPLLRPRRPADPALMPLSRCARRRPRGRTRRRGCCARSRSGRDRERRWGQLASWIGVAIVGLLTLAALFAPPDLPGGPNQQDLLNTLQPPSWRHPFGTDNLGRDIFTRSIYAARIDLDVGLITTYVPLVLGVLLGARRRLPRRVARDGGRCAPSTSSSPSRSSSS